MTDSVIAGLSVIAVFAGVRTLYKAMHKEFGRYAFVVMGGTAALAALLAVLNL